MLLWFQFLWACPFSILHKISGVVGNYFGKHKDFRERRQWSHGYCKAPSVQLGDLPHYPVAFFAFPAWQCQEGASISSAKKGELWIQLALVECSLQQSLSSAVRCDPSPSLELVFLAPRDIKQGFLWCHHLSDPVADTKYPQGHWVHLLQQNT